MHSFTVLVLRLTVCFLSSFPDSLPQLFLRCLLQTFVFHIFRFASIFFRPFLLLLPTTQPSVSLFPFLLILPHSGCLSVRFHFRFNVFPIISYLISHVFFPGSRTRLTDGFLSFYPASLPQLFHRWFPLIPLRDKCLTFHFLSSISVLALHYLTFCFFRSLFTCFNLTVISAVIVFWFLILRFTIISCLISHAFFPGSGTWLSVCFFSLFPVSLPQPFHRRFPLISL